MASTHLAERKPIYRSLYFQVLVGITVGVLLGYFAPAWGEQMKPLGDGFVKLIRMMIAPIIFCTVVNGIAGIGDMKKLGRVGLKALLYFEVVTTISLVIGLIVVKIVQPGVGVNADPSTLDTKSVAQYTAQSSHLTTTEFVLNIIPNAFVDAFAKGDILQVLFLAILFGLGLSAFDKAQPVIDAFHAINHILFNIIGIIMKVAPIGAFGAMAFTIGRYGIKTLVSLEIGRAHV